MMIKHVMKSLMLITITIAAVLSSASIAITNVNASGLGISDFAEHPEQVCATYGDRPEMKDLCDWIDICDDSGKVNSTSKFCTGKAVRGIPYPPGGCCVSEAAGKREYHLTY
jgi:hypothetical protein